MYHGLNNLQNIYFTKKRIYRRDSYNQGNARLAP